MLFLWEKKKKSSKLLSGRKRLVSTLVSVEVVWVGGPCCRGGWSELLKPGWASFVRNMRESYLVSSPITLWEIDGETLETVKDFILEGSKITSGEGNGTPLQYSCLENPIDGGAW